MERNPREIRGNYYLKDRTHVSYQSYFTYIIDKSNEIVKRDYPTQR